MLHTQSYIHCHTNTTTHTYTQTKHTDVLYGQYWAPGLDEPKGDVFYFDYGVVAFWGLTAKEEQDVLDVCVCGGWVLGGARCMYVHACVHKCMCITQHVASMCIPSLHTHIHKHTYIHTQTSYPFTIIHLVPPHTHTHHPPITACGGTSGATTFTCN